MTSTNSTNSMNSKYLPLMKSPEAFCSDKVLYEDKSNKSFDRRQRLKSKDFWKIDKNYEFQSDIDDVISSINSSFESESINNSISCCDNSLYQNESCMDSLYEPLDIDKSVAGASEKIRDLSDDDRSIFHKPTLNRTFSIESDHLDEIENLIFDSLECEATCAPRKLSVGRTFSIEDDHKGKIQQENIQDVSNNADPLGKNGFPVTKSSERQSFIPGGDVMNIMKFVREISMTSKNSPTKIESPQITENSISVDFIANQEEVINNTSDSIYNYGDKLSPTLKSKKILNEEEMNISGDRILYLKASQNNIPPKYGNTESMDADISSSEDDSLEMNYKKYDITSNKTSSSLNGTKVINENGINIITDDIINATVQESFNDTKVINNMEFSENRNIMCEDKLDLSNNRNRPIKKILKELFIDKMSTDDSDFSNETVVSASHSSLESKINKTKELNLGYVEDHKAEIFAESNQVSALENWERTRKSLMNKRSELNEKSMNYNNFCLNESTILAEVNSEIYFLQEAEDEYMLNEINFKSKAVEEIFNNFMFLGDSKTMSSIDEDEDSIKQILDDTQDLEIEQQIEISESSIHDYIPLKGDSYADSDNPKKIIDGADEYWTHTDLIQCSDTENYNEADLDTLNKIDAKKIMFLEDSKTISGIEYDQDINKILEDTQDFEKA
ncbi:unnamed protein product, partial [Meganyctiphanes norvegica]